MMMIQQCSSDMRGNNNNSCAAAIPACPPVRSRISIVGPHHCIKILINIDCVNDDVAAVVVVIAGATVNPPANVAQQTD